MRNWIKIALLGCTCLLTRPASSQVVRHLPPLIVTLDSGTTTLRPFIGIAPSAYESLRVNARLDSLQLAERAAQLRQWRELHVHDSLATVQVARELHTTRVDNAALSMDLTKQTERTNKALALPLRPPLVFDGHFYTGVGVGGVLVTVGGVLLKVFVFH